MSKGKFIFGPLGDDLISDQNKIIDILYNFIKEQKDDLFLLSTQVMTPTVLPYATFIGLHILPYTIGFAIIK